MESGNHGHVVALAGGVGGAKLARGLALAGLGERLSVVVNTADDMQLFGLHIAPDLDTVMYTLAGLANPVQGWGIVDESFTTLEMIKGYGRDAWFLLGDKDLATHILRTERLRAGIGLTDVTAELSAALGITARILPMCDEPVATRVATPDGELEFQEYFVRRRHADDVSGVRFEGIEAARVTPQVTAALDAAACVILCPSNPFVSIDPILAVGDFRSRLAAPVVAVSPIVGGQAIKGPAAHMLQTLGHDVSALGVAALYRDFLNGMVIDTVDEELATPIEALGIATLVTNTVMHSDSDRKTLADETLAFAARLAG
jgi:LPPG:FO 2-phospho-L-lactate transferase